MYFTKVTHELVPKNKLQKQVQDLVKSYNRLLIDPIDLNLFKIQIVERIDELNKQNPRCKPVEPSFYSHNQIDHQLYFGDSLISFSIYKAKATFSVNTRTQI